MLYEVITIKPVADKVAADNDVPHWGFIQYTAQAARYMPLAYQRAQEEWPWMGVINYWFFNVITSYSIHYTKLYDGPSTLPRRPTTGIMSGVAMQRSKSISPA